MMMRCKICGKQYITYQDLSEHLQLHNIKSEYSSTFIMEYERDNNCIMLDKVISRYGNEWINSKFGQELTYLTYKDIKFLPKEEEYKLSLYIFCNSIYAEYCIYNFLMENNVNFVHHDKTQIKPYELDFYIPFNKIGIVCNMDENQDKQKMKLCEEKGISLHFITENNIEFQKYLLKNLFTSK